eukprot:12574907-Ditylum_brightwellii.AAC.1
MLEVAVTRAAHRLICYLQSTYSIEFKWEEVKGRADKDQRWEELSRNKQLNTLCDKVAKAHLHFIINNIRPLLQVPFEG